MNLYFIKINLRNFTFVMCCLGKHEIKVNIIDEGVNLFPKRNIKSHQKTFRKPLRNN